MTDRPANANPARDVAAKLLDALADEQRALAGNHVDALEQSVRAKQALIAEINAATSAVAPIVDPDLKRLLQQCRHQNEINGAMVAARLHLTELSLAILRGDAQTTLYGPHGSTAGGSGTGRTIARA